jgi:hypothetical protein
MRGRLLTGEGQLCCTGDVNRQRWIRLPDVLNRLPVVLADAEPARPATATTATALPMQRLYRPAAHLEDVEPVLITMEELYNGQLSTDIFGVSLCSQLSPQPGFAVCHNDGYIMQWSRDKQLCLKTFPLTRGAPLWNPTARTVDITYVSDGGSSFTIKIGCGSGSLSPKEATYVTVDKRSDGSLSYTMQATDHRICSP